MFENSQVDIHTLPSMKEVDFSELEKDYLYVRLLASFLFSLVILVGGVIVLFSTGLWREYLAWISVTGGWVLITGLILLLEYLGFYKKAYALRDRDIIYRSGLIFHSITTIPFNRIQHVDIKQGPIESAFDLARLNVYTAGGQGSDLGIPGLHHAQAERLKAFILNKTARDEEE